MYAAKIGNRALGLSFDEENNKKASRRAALLRIETIEFRNADLRELDYLVTSIGKFDQIMCLECIEHIENDQKLVRDLAALLKPAGILILTTPYKHHKAYYGETLSLNEDGGHVRWGYTHDELGEMLAHSGMTVVAVDFISGFVTQKLASLRLRSLAFPVWRSLIFPEPGYRSIWKTSPSESPVPNWLTILGFRSTTRRGSGP